MSWTRIGIHKISQTVIDGRTKRTLAETPEYSCYAETRDLYGQELYEALNIGLKETVVFRVRSCRWIKTLKPQMRDYRVLYDGYEYDIYAVDFGSTDHRVAELKCSRAT